MIIEKNEAKISVNLGRVWEETGLKGSHEASNAFLSRKRQQWKRYEALGQTLLPPFTSKSYNYRDSAELIVLQPFSWLKEEPWGILGMEMDE